MGISTPHIPVLTTESIAFLNAHDNGIYVDATVGDGGHSALLLEKHPGIKQLIGIDHDMDAVRRAQKNLGRYSDKVLVLHGNFGNLVNILEKAGIHAIDGILFDLGVSTSQLKDPERGFSFTVDGALDMRMDQSIPLQAQDLIEQASARQLEKIIREFGEERWAKKIACSIKKNQQQRPVTRTTDLAEIVSRAIPARHHPRRIHPATKTFQALRIAVNDELAALEKGLEGAVSIVRAGGRVCVISFHSLEDRIVKNTFRLWSRSCICPPDTPVCICNHRKKASIVTRKPVSPSPQELQHNPRARSAKLRVAERVPAEA